MLQAVTGYKLGLTETQRSSTCLCRRQMLETKLMNQEIQKLLDKGPSSRLQKLHLRVTISKFSLFPKRRTIQTSDKFAPPKQLDPLPTFQNGKNLCSDGPPTERGLLYLN